jgi:hypothetical protein
MSKKLAGVAIIALTGGTGCCLHVGVKAGTIVVLALAGLAHALISQGGTQGTGALKGRDEKVDEGGTGAGRIT